MSTNNVLREFFGDDHPEIAKNGGIQAMAECLASARLYRITQSAIITGLEEELTQLLADRSHEGLQAENERLRALVAALLAALTPPEER